MTDEQKAAYVMSQSVAALGEILGMHAENQVRQFDSKSPAYGYEEMHQVSVDHGLHHKAIVEFLVQK